MIGSPQAGQHTGQITALQGALSRAEVLIRQLQGKAVEFAKPKVPIVVVLPSAPYDGQQVDFQNAAMATLGVRWRFVYRAASVSPYKWEYVGGAAAPTFADAQLPIATTTYAPLGVGFTVPLTGQYQAHFGAFCYGAGATLRNTFMAVDPVDASGLVWWINDNVQNGNARTRVVTRTAGTLIELLARNAVPATSYWVNPWLNVTPIRVA